MNEHEFIDVDRKLFERLSHGALGQITLRLKNGTSICGDAKGVARGNDPVPVGYWGRVLITVDGEDVEIRYSEIAEVV